MRYISLLVIACVSILFGLSFIPHLAGGIWWLSLFIHFKVQYAVILLLFLVPALFLRQRTWLILAVTGILWNAFFIVPLWIPPDNTRVSQNVTPDPSVACINLLAANRDFDKVRRYIRNGHPDIVVLLEYNSAWAAALEGTLESYSDRMEIPRKDNFGIAVFSRKAAWFEHMEIPGCPPMIEAGFHIRDVPVRLIAVHTVPPTSEANFRLRNRQLRLLSEAMKEDGAAIVAGDLNTTSFSPEFREFTDRSGLRDSRKGFGLQTTWPAWFAPMAVTLDHILVSPGLRITDRKTGPGIGSDHLPVRISFQVH